jgi:hypothetical protein
LFSEFELLNGKPSELQQIQRILDSTILQFIIPYIKINVTGLEIKITYEKKIPAILSRRFGYYTGLSDIDENITVYSGTHRVHIIGLDGQVYYTGSLPFIFVPRYLMLIGTYEQIEVENIITI